MAETLEFLRDVPIFDGLRPEDLELMASSMRVVSLVEGPIIRENEPPDGLYIIKSGTVKVTKSAQAEGVEATLAILRGGDSFGEMSLIDGLPHSADVAAMQPVECYFLGRDDFMAALPRHAELARGILKAAVGMVRNADEWVARTI
jgi:CRP-like cAMP-binding protein